MISARGYRPGFFGPAQPVTEAERRRAVARLRPHLSPAVVGALPARIRKRRRDAESDEATTAGAATRAAKAGAVNRKQRLLQRATLGWTLAEQRLVDEIGYDVWLERQLDHTSIDDSELENALASALPTLAMSPAQVLRTAENDPGRPIFELIVGSIYRALYSPRQLYERMVIFWSDHFSIHIFSDLAFFLKPTDDREVIRANALGTFPELLSASAHSPAMLSYLTNDSNVKGAPNENYARELMELHTLGVDRGYTEKDVKEVARCFTGWTYDRGRLDASNVGRFAFLAAAHDDGEKRVLGRTIPAGGGIEDGERVLEILGGHPNTARFIAEKMLRYFWRYEPRRATVNKLKKVYMSTGGDIREMLRWTLAQKRMSTARPKLKRPLHLMTSALRALAAELGSPGYTLEQLFVAGHVPFNWEPPNGYPDSEGYWSGFVLPRWNFASTFLNGNRRTGIRADLSAFDPDRPVARLVDDMDAVLLNGTMSKATRDAVVSFLGAGKTTKKRIGEAIGLVVASPEFQEY